MRVDIEITIIESGYIAKFGDLHIVHFDSVDDLYNEIKKYRARIRKDKAAPKEQPL